MTISNTTTYYCWKSLYGNLTCYTVEALPDFGYKVYRLTTGNELPTPTEDTVTVVATGGNSITCSDDITYYKSFDDNITMTNEYYAWYSASYGLNIYTTKPVPTNGDDLYIVDGNTVVYVQDKVDVGSIIQVLVTTSYSVYATMYDRNTEKDLLTTVEELGLKDGEGVETVYRIRDAQAVADAMLLRYSKQDTLVSGTNIKTINGTSVLGSGDISIGAESLPSQTGNADKFLKTNGTTASWGIPKTFNLFDFKYSDHTLNDMSWLRADTFSWQSGTTYSTAYNELLSEYNAQKVDLYAYKDTDNNIIYTNTDEPTTSDYAYGGSPIHQLGAITSVSGDDITYNSTTYTRSTTDDTEDVIHTLEGSIYYVRTTKGYKIALASQESAILSKYNTDGIAWYYILDTTNTRFKLPRTKWGFKGLRDNVGDDIAESLPNISGDFFTEAGLSNASGAFSLGNNPYRGTTSGSTNNQINFNASNSSSTYQDNAPVQERATQMYLYFYVGEFSQTATEQTAGLNAELFNGKQDVCTHIIATYVNGTSGYRIWSDGYCEQWGVFSGTTCSKTITLLKTYSNSDYIISGLSDNNSGIAGSYTMIDENSQTTTSFIIVVNFRDTQPTNKKIRWKTSGYLAQGQY